MAKICAIEVSHPQWRLFLDLRVPLIDDKQEKLTGRCLTLADNKRSALQKLDTHDIAGRALGRHDIGGSARSGLTPNG